MSTSDDAWATLDELLGMEALAAEAGSGGGVGRLSFYGRCSTEDNQDPATSKAWQLGEAARFVEPLGGEIVAEYFDIGQSRSLPWERRDEASRVLRALKDPGRGWDGLVVGEATRCWFSNQFSLTWPKFDRFGVSLWIPSLGGRFDPENTVHDMAMTITGGLSKSERQHVQKRVRAAMAAQVLIDGRFQGGRAPYGYRVVDGGPHPHPKKAAEGQRLRVMVVDELAAAVVRRIFGMYLDGWGRKAIAEQLNREGVPCPSAHAPDQNRHRIMDGWQHSTIAAVLENPRYTGYAIYGRWQKVEELLDADDVAAGYVVKFRRSPQAKIVRSRNPAHPEVVSVEMFTAAELEKRRRRVGGQKGWSSQPRRPAPRGRTYVLRGRITCSICSRRFEGAARRAETIYYRCNARTLVPGSAVALAHPRQIYLREDAVVPALNRWVGTLFDPLHREATIDALLVDGEPESDRGAYVEELRGRVRAAKVTMDRARKALEAGWDPAELRDQYNAAAAEKQVAERALAAVPDREVLNRDQLVTYVEELGDVGRALDAADPAELSELYEALKLGLTYNYADQTVGVEIDPLADRVAKYRVRGGT
ncbi:recombinase family protein [Kribbella sandramycini]|uniref:Recombinase family protein n=1 Tax=Kribbella sandramycini TaxID=60450 RepID=A0A7Y4NZ72_9ACTN|nr:recombinase family protein [Kribbella sandramycini]NOL40548.1 recombinase family protein [Kribbella sandramycini]